jgi:hypothetical protein
MHKLIDKLCNLRITQKRVFPSLGTDGGCRAVAGKYFSFVGQWKQTGLDGVDNLAVVSAGQVGAADAAGKERV